MDEPKNLTDGLEDNLRKNMKAQREALGLTQSELAQRVTDAGLKGFHQTTIARIEKGERPLKAVEAITVARVLQTSVEFLVEGPTSAFLRSLAVSLDEKARQISLDIGSLTGARLELARALDAIDRGEDVAGQALEESVDPMLLVLLEASFRSSSPNNRTLSSYMKYVRDGKVLAEGEYPSDLGEHEVELYREIMQTLRAHPDLGHTF